MVVVISPLLSSHPFGSSSRPDNMLLEICCPSYSPPPPGLFIMSTQGHVDLPPPSSFRSPSPSAVVALVGWSRQATPLRYHHVCIHALMHDGRQVPSKGPPRRTILGMLIRILPASLCRCQRTCSAPVHRVVAFALCALLPLAPSVLESHVYGASI